MRTVVITSLMSMVLVGCSMGFAESALVTASLVDEDGGSEDQDGGVARDAGVATDAGAAADAGASDGGASAADAGLAADAGADAGASPCLGVTCSAGARCEPATGTCTCSPGFTGDGLTCTAVAPGNPETRTEPEVCGAWRSAQARREPGDGFTVSNATCDRGDLSRRSRDDALVRLNFYRWLAGLGPTVDDARADDVAQSCALVSAWNPAGPQAHFPPASSTCYSSDGSAGAGSSNIAWGARDAADAIDLWMIDFGNEASFGHRRWLLNPPLSPVGIGHYRGGTSYGSASCIGVFGSSGTGPRPAFTAFPPPGFSPTALTQWHWTIHGNVPLSGTAASVVRVSDSQPMPVRLEVLNGSYGQAAVALFRDGWNPVAGETYHVTLVGTGGLGRVEYDVKPTDCP